MSSKTSKSNKSKHIDIDIDTKMKDPQYQELFKKFLKSQADGKEIKSKPTCPSAVKIATKADVNKSIEENINVYCLKSKDNKSEYYRHCTRPVTEGKQNCHSHNKQVESNPDHVLNFEDDVVNNSNSIKMGKGDILVIKKQPSNKTTDENPDPIIVVKISKNIKDQLSKFANTNLDDTKEKEETDSEENEKAESDFEDNESNEEDEEIETEEVEATEIEEAVEETEEEEEEEDEEDEEDEGTDCKEFQTKDGRTLYLEPNENQILELDDQGEGTPLGVYTVVNDKNAPIEMNGEQVIAANDFKQGKFNYLRCGLSNKLYQQKEKNIIKVGRVDVTKNGTFKVFLDNVKKI